MMPPKTKRRPFASVRIIFLLFICQALFISVIPFFTFNAQTETSRGGSGYHTYEEMVTEIQNIEVNHSTIVKLYNLTTTFEGRTVWAVKISDNPQENDSTEPDVLVMAGQKANSLISVEIALYLLDHLTKNFGADARITELVNNREVWIIPMVNPDGHAFVNEGNEEWVKNRRNNGDTSFGVNLNRNYDFNWGIMDNHTSHDTGSPYYHGPYAFSESETEAIRDLVESQNFVFSLSLSSFGDKITYPWGYNESSTPDDDLLSEIARDMSMYSGYSVSQNGSIYINHGNVDDWLYNTSVLPFTVLAGEADIPEEPQIEIIAQENIPSCLYLLDIADDPNRALKAEWTFMVYMSGDGGLEEEGFLDINEMEKVGSSPYMNIVVQFDRGVGDFTTNPDWTTTRRFLIERDDDEDIIGSTFIEDLGEKNMASSQTLSQFVNWSMDNFPAEHYFLDLWGHGKGWMGVVLDSGDWLNMDELKLAFTTFDDRVDIVGFDNCNMAMIEVYTQLMGHVDYIVGSEKEEDAWGWPYDRIFENLSAEPQTSPVNLSTLITLGFVDWAIEEKSSYSATASVVDMSHLQKVLNRTDIFARELNRTLGLYSKEIGKAIDDTEDYFRSPTPHDYYHFAELIGEYVPNRLIRIAAEDVMTSIEEFVVAESHWSNSQDPYVKVVDNAHGIAIWMYDGNDFQTYEDLDFSKMTYWDEFLIASNNPPSKPQVNFSVNYSLSDSDNESNDDTITLLYTSDTTGLDIAVCVINHENQHIDTFYVNNTIQDQAYNFSFNPYKKGYPSDYYSFCAYLVDDSDIPQNYSEVIEIWLGNERPDVALINVTFYRKDGIIVGGDTGKKPIDGENTVIEVYVVNNGTIGLPDVKVEFLEGNKPIKTNVVDLEIGEEKSITAQWAAISGQRIIRIVLDGENNIKEANESNNVIVENVTVKPNIPVEPLIVKGKVYSRGKVNIIGAKVRIKNLRTNMTKNDTTDKGGYNISLDSDWYHEGDLIDVRAEYNSVSNNITVYAYSDDKIINIDITLDTDVYDALFFFKIGLIIFEIIGFILVIKYYIGTRKHRGGE